MPTLSSKISRMRSVKLPFHKEKNMEKQPGYLPTKASTPSSPIVPLSPTTTTTSFSETLRVISKEAEKTQFDDVFNSFFFTDQRCQNRALFMASKLHQSLDSLVHPMRPNSTDGSQALHNSPIPTPSRSTPLASSSSDKKYTVDGFWRTVAHRLYTLNYILFVLPSDSQTRIAFLNRLEANLATVSDGKEIDRRGGMEAHFAMRYALNHRRSPRRKTLLQDAFLEEKRNGGNVAGAILPSHSLDNTDHIVREAQKVIEQCLISESQLGHVEKDAMYVYHSMRAGFHGSFEPHIELEEDKPLRHRLKRTVDTNKKPHYVNPFEDEACIVKEEEYPKRDMDSGFHEVIPLA